MTPDAECEAPNAHRERDEVMSNRRKEGWHMCMCVSSVQCVRACVGQSMTVSICRPVHSAKSHDL